MGLAFYTIGQSSLRCIGIGGGSFGGTWDILGWSGRYGCCFLRELKGLVISGDCVWEEADEFFREFDFFEGDICAVCPFSIASSNAIEVGRKHLGLLQLISLLEI